MGKNNQIIIKTPETFSKLGRSASSIIREGLLGYLEKDNLIINVEDFTSFHNIFYVINNLKKYENNNIILSLPFSNTAAFGVSDIKLLKYIFDISTKFIVFIPFNKIDCIEIDRSNYIIYIKHKVHFSHEDKRDWPVPIVGLYNTVNDVFLHTSSLEYIQIGFCFANCKYRDALFNNIIYYFKYDISVKLGIPIDELFKIIDSDSENDFSIDDVLSLIKINDDSDVKGEYVPLKKSNLFNDFLTYDGG